jgi:protein gp37
MNASARKIEQRVEDIHRCDLLMAGVSNIEWTELTWNPVTGCSKVSAGCAFCYAERYAKRLHEMGNKRYANGFRVTLHWDVIEYPRRWQRPSIIFVNSMSDLFHDRVPVRFIKRVFGTMNDCYWHQFQLLTKRSKRLTELAPELNWTPNIWMGVSVESQEYVPRIRDLRKVPAKTRFLSCEPLLAPIDNLDLDGIHWVIVGGESGPNARPMRREWVDSIRRQCDKADVAFFFKQWGGTQKWKNGRKLNGKIYNQMPALDGKQGFFGFKEHQIRHVG